MGARGRAGKAGAAVQGLSITELLVVMAVLSVGAALATPALGPAVESMKLTVWANNFHAHLILARSEAIKRNHRVVVCASGDGMRCSHEGDWDQGWLVFEDTDNNGARSNGETVIETMSSLPRAFRLTGNQSVARYVSYSPTGSTRSVSGAFQAGTVTLCSADHATEARQIVINAAGRPRIYKASAQVCS